MTFSEARDLLVYFNKWRRDDNVPNSYEMPNPTEIGKAIDTAVDALSICLSLDAESFNEGMAQSAKLFYYERKFPLND